MYSCASVCIIEYNEMIGLREFEGEKKLSRRDDKKKKKRRLDFTT